jgi:hypothetical protein
MRPCLWATVETENPLDFAMQFVGQINVAAAAAIGTAVMLELLQLDREGLVELRNSAGKYHAAPRGIFLHDGESMRVGEFPNFRNIGRLRAKPLGEFLAPDMSWTAVGPMKLLDVFAQPICAAMAQQNGYLQAFVRISPAKRLCAFNRLSLAAFQNVFGHNLTSFDCKTVTAWRCSHCATKVPHENRAIAKI